MLGGIRPAGGRGEDRGYPQRNSPRGRKLRHGEEEGTGGREPRSWSAVGCGKDGSASSEGGFGVIFGAF